MCIRDRANIDTSGWDYDQKAVVANVRTAEPHQETAWQRFLPAGPLAFLPLADGRCSIVWSTAPETADELLARDEADFARILADAFDRRLGEIVEVGPRSAFPPVSYTHLDVYKRQALGGGDGENGSFGNVIVGSELGHIVG